MKATYLATPRYPLTALFLALGLTLAAAGCTDGDAGGSSGSNTANAGVENEAVALTAAEADTQPAAEPESESELPTIGTLTIEGATFDLNLAYWCEAEPGVQSGTTVVHRVAAYGNDGEVIVLGLQVDGAHSSGPVQNVTLSTDSSTNYSSGDVLSARSSGPILVVENREVRVHGDVRRPGGDITEVEAAFTLPAEPGFPGYC